MSLFEKPKTDDQVARRYRLWKSACAVSVVWNLATGVMNILLGSYLLAVTCALVAIISAPFFFIARIEERAAWARWQRTVELMIAGVIARDVQ